MKLKCVVFVFDGTLVDSMYLWDTVAESYVRSRGKEPKPIVREEVRALSLLQAAEHLKKEYDLAEMPQVIMAGIDRIIHGLDLFIGEDILQVSLEEIPAVGAHDHIVAIFILGSDQSIQRKWHGFHHVLCHGFLRVRGGHGGGLSLGKAAHQEGQCQ